MPGHHSASIIVNRERELITKIRKLFEILQNWQGICHTKYQNTDQAWNTVVVETLASFFLIFFDFKKKKYHIHRKHEGKIKLTKKQ